MGIPENLEIKSLRVAFINEISKDFRIKLFAMSALNDSETIKKGETKWLIVRPETCNHN